MSSFRICAIGDVVGRPGRKCLTTLLPQVKERHQPDLIISNGENAAGGFGLTENIFTSFVDEYGIDVVTTGNHWHDKREILMFVDQNPRLLRPANMFNVPKIEAGYLVKRKKGCVFAVINLLGRTFMKGDNRCPFEAFDLIERRVPSGVKVKVVDFHAETTSEKQAFAHYVAGRASVVYGTHTHCPTSDARILAKHTGYVTDLGMTGAYDSVIGMKVECSLPVFIPRLERKKLVPATEDVQLWAIIADVEIHSGRCERIEQLRLDL